MQEKPGRKKREEKERRPAQTSVALAMTTQSKLKGQKENKKKTKRKKENKKEKKKPPKKTPETTSKNTPKNTQLFFLFLSSLFFSSLLFLSCFLSFERRKMDIVSEKCGGEKCLCHQKQKHGNISHFVEVRDEPVHPQSFENDLVRIYKAQIPTGKESLYHRHKLNTCYICLRDASALNCNGEEPFLHNVQKGEVFARTHVLRDGREFSLVHAVCNVGGETTNFMGIEVKDVPNVKEKEEETPSLEETQFSKQIEITHKNYFKMKGVETPSFSAFRLEIKDEGETTGFHVLPYRGVVVVVNSEQDRWSLSYQLPSSSPLFSFKSKLLGDFCYFDGTKNPIPFEITNLSSSTPLHLIFLFI